MDPVEQDMGASSLREDRVEWGTSPRGYREAKREALRERVRWLRAGRPIEDDPLRARITTGDTK